MCTTHASVILRHTTTQPGIRNQCTHRLCKETTLGMPVPTVVGRACKQEQVYIHVYQASLVESAVHTYMYSLGFQ